MGFFTFLLYIFFFFFACFTLGFHTHFSELCVAGQLTLKSVSDCTYAQSALSFLQAANKHEITQPQMYWDFYITRTVQKDVHNPLSIDNIDI